MSATRVIQKTLTGESVQLPPIRSTRNVYSHEKGEVSPHNWYTAVAGFSGDFVLKTLKQHASRSGSVVIDPFSGTGTTALTAMTSGMKVFGVEANPFHHLVATAKFNLRVDQEDLGAARKKLGSILRSSLENDGRYQFEKVPTILINDHLSSIKNSNCGPPEMPHLHKWMSKRVLDRVLWVKEALRELTDGGYSQGVLDIARVAFGAILLPVSNMQMAGPKIAYRRKNGNRIVCRDAPVVDLFLRKLDSMISDVRAVSSHSSWIPPEVSLGDSRQVDKLIGVEADIALTSPPYLNEVDYIENTRLELYFLELVRSEAEMRQLKERFFRANSKYLFKSNRDYPERLPDFASFDEIRVICARIEKVWEQRSWGWDHPRLVAEYFVDLTRHLEGMLRCLRPGARYVIIIGDSAIDGILVQTDEILAKLAKDVGFKRTEVSPFRDRTSSRHKTRLRESVVTLTA